eukprot:7391951-Prymnesium_polylepis.2
MVCNGRRRRICSSKKSVSFASLMSWSPREVRIRSASRSARAFFRRRAFISRACVRCISAV